MFAGAVKDIANTSFYLYQTDPYYTMTPTEYYNYHAYLYYVTGNGTFGIIGTNIPQGIRPVINISSTVTVSGKGTQSNPYVIDNS